MALCGLIAASLWAAESPSLEREVANAARWLADSQPGLPATERDRLAHELGLGNYRHLSFEQAFNSRDTNRMSALLREEPRLAARAVHFGFPPGILPASDDHFPHGQPLLVAAEQGWVEVAAALLGAGVDVDRQGDTSRSGGSRVTALHLAAAEGQVPIIELLLAHKANPNAAAFGRRTALHYLLEGRHPSESREWTRERPEDRLAILKLLLRHGADVFWTNLSGRSPLDSVVVANSTRDGWLEQAGNRAPAGLLDQQRQEQARGARLLDVLLGGAGLAQRDSAGNSPLHWAARLDRTNAVLELLQRHADVTGANRAGLTPLQEAAFAGRAAAAGLLLAGGATLDPFSACALGRLEALAPMLRQQADLIRSVNAQGETLLHWAAAHGHKDVTESLLALAAPTGARDQRGQTALHAAAVHGHRDVAALLVAHGADVNLQDITGATPLALAAEQGHEPMVNLLLEYRPDVNAGSGKAGTALHRAAAAGHTTIVERLLKAGAQANLLDDKRRTPLHLAAANGHSEVARLLLDGGADLAARDAENRTPLALAAAHGGQEMVDLLTAPKPGAEPSRRQLTDALVTALDSGNPESVADLVALGADPNVRSAKGTTALHLAAERENYSQMIYLLKHGADIDAPDAEGDTLLHAKMKFTFEDRADEEQENEPSGSEESRWFGRPVQFLLHHKAKVNARNKRGQTPLHVLARRTDSGPSASETVDLLVGLLIARGGRLDVQDNKGRTPLHIAAEGGSPAVVEALIRHGASLRARDAHGCTPLHRAFNDSVFEEGLWPQPGVVEALLSHGADPNAADDQGDTPLHCAARTHPGRPEDIRLLLGHGARRNTQNKRGQNPWEVAAQAGWGVERFLLPDGISQDIFDAIQHTNYPAAVAALTAQPAMARAVRDYRHTPLHLAAMKGLTNFTELLLRYKPPLDATNDSLLTPLGAALVGGHLNVAEQLARAGAVVPVGAAAALGRADLVTAALREDRSAVKNKLGGRTPLQWGAQHGRTEVVRLLLEGGAPVASPEEEGYSALYYATRNGHSGVAELLLRHGAGNDPFTLAATGDSVRLKALLRQDSAQLRGTSPQGRTLLHAAAAAGQASTADVLLSLGLDVHAISKSGWTPLHEAVWYGQQETTALLIARGADVNQRATRNRATPLHLAVFQRHRALVEWLLDHGADVNARKEGEGTLLREAKSHSYGPEGKAIVQLLERHGGKE